MNDPLDRDVKAELREGLADVPVPADAQARLERSFAPLLSGPDGGPAGDHGAGAGAGSAAGSRASTLLKAAALVGVGVVLGAGIAEIRHARTPPAPRVVEKTVFVERELHVPAPSVAPSASALLPTSPVSRPQPPTPEPPPLTRDADLRRERVIVEAARSALARNDASAALERVDEHARLFPHGQLAESREALRIQALVLAGRRDDAESRAAEFKRRYPHGLFGPVVDEALRRRR